jgi:ferric-dicitrate binding protein FerR (iron transport regulator)
VTPAQEEKLDRVLQLSAQHTVLLAGLKEWLQHVANAQNKLEGKVIHLEAEREGRGRHGVLRVAALSALFSGLSALAAWTTRLFGTH